MGKFIDTGQHIVSFPCPVKYRCLFEIKVYLTITSQGGGIAISTQDRRPAISQVNNKGYYVSLHLARKKQQRTLNINQLRILG
jgi:hypothetical protein